MSNFEINLVMKVAIIFITALVIGITGDKTWGWLLLLLLIKKEK